MNTETRNLLKMRTAAMAKAPEELRESSTLIWIIEFNLGGENYGVETAFVREVYPLRDFTPLPGIPSYIHGIVNIRGQIMPIVDLKKFFNLPAKGLGELNKIIVLQNDQMEFGILADEVKGTKLIFKEDLLPVPPVIKGIGEKYLTGVTKNRLILLSAENLLRDKTIIVNEEVS